MSLSSSFSIESLVGRQDVKKEISSEKRESVVMDENGKPRQQMPNAGSACGDDEDDFDDDDFEQSPGEFSRRNSAFSAPAGCRTQPTESADKNTNEERQNSGHEQGWHGVMLPHLQMAANNPFLMGLGFPYLSQGQELMKNGLSLPMDMLLRNNAMGNQQMHNPLLTHQWVDWLQQSNGHARYLAGAGEGHASLLFQPYRKPKRVRTAFSPYQLLQLEKEFEGNHYVVGTERKKLANRLDLSETQVKVWFQNRRTKDKRVKSEEEMKKISASRSSENSEKCEASISIKTDQSEHLHG